MHETDGRQDEVLSRHVPTGAGYDEITVEMEQSMLADAEESVVAYWETVLEQPRGAASIARQAAAHSIEVDELGADGARRMRAVDPDRVLMRAVVKDPDLAPACADLRRAAGRADRARQAVVLAYAPRVPAVAQAYVGFSMTKQDQVQEGLIGLHVAVDRYDVTRGVRFWTYAYWWVRQFCTRALTRRSRLVRVSQHDVATLRDHDARDRAGLPQVGGDVDIAMLRRIAGSHTVGWDTPVSGDQALLWSDVVPDPGAAPERVFVGLDSRSIGEAMRRLTSREADVVRRRYGLDGDEQTQAEIAVDYGISRPRVGQIEMAAMRKLRAVLGADAMDA